jgi:hypothetical protein
VTSYSNFEETLEKRKLKMKKGKTVKLLPKKKHIKLVMTTAQSLPKRVMKTL